MGVSSRKSLFLYRSILQSPIKINLRFFQFFLFIINYFLISWQFHFCETFVSYKAFRIFRANRYYLCFFLTPALCMLNSFIISSSSNFIFSTTTGEQAGDDAATTICFLPCHLSLEHLFHTNTLTGSLAFWLNPGKHRMKIEC